MPCRCKQRAPSHHRVWPPISKSRGRCLRLRRFFPRYKRGGDDLPMQAEGAESSSGLAADLQVSREMSSAPPVFSWLPARSAVAGAACQRSGKHRMYVLVVCTPVLLVRGLYGWQGLVKGYGTASLCYTILSYTLYEQCFVCLYTAVIYPFLVLIVSGQIEGSSNGERTRGWQETQRTLQSANRRRCGECKGRFRNGMSTER